VQERGDHVRRHSEKRFSHLTNPGDRGRRRACSPTLGFMPIPAIIADVPFPLASNEQFIRSDFQLNLTKLDGKESHSFFREWC
jgi:hypothetical protein